MITIRCLTDGVIINGQTLRATQVIELDDADDALVLSLRIKQAAGDIAVEGLPASKPAGREGGEVFMRSLDSLKDSSK
jgi:hypothetical protein